MLTPLKIVFELDGTGIIMNPADPLHLDGLLEWCAMPVGKIKPLNRNDQITFSPELPLAKWNHLDQWGWKASALFFEPARHIDSVQYWRKKFRQNKLQVTSGSVNLMSGIFREYNMPMALSLCHRMVAFALGDADKVSKLLSKLRYLGKKAAYGKGRINKVIVTPIADDYSIIKDGRYTRYYPKNDGVRFGRIKAPYWNTTERCKTCYVGDPVGEKSN